jgi:hypothetical protein
MLEVSRPLETNGYAEYPLETRFLKLPAMNYMQLLDIEPCRPQYAILNAVNSPDYRFITACVSRRVGKTYIANIICQLTALIPGTTCLIIAPDYTLASISWDLQRQLLDLFDVERVRDNAKDRVIELANGSMIRIASVSRVDSAVGRSYDLIIFDEAALNDDGGVAFNINLRPTLDKDNSKCIFISTPRGDNWFKEFYDRGFSSLPEHSGWVSIHADYKENPRASEKDIAEARATLSHAEFEQEYMANFVTFEGQVYSLDTDQIVDTSEIVEKALARRNSVDIIGGLDLGFRDETAFTVILIITGEDDELEFYIIDEYMKSKASTEEHAKNIQRLVELYDIDYIYIDSAAAQTKYDFAYLYDISTVNAKKSILDGIGLCSALLDHNRVFVDQNCVENIYSLRNYKWKKNTDLEKTEHDRASHMADAIRYALYTYASTNL